MKNKTFKYDNGNISYYITPKSKKTILMLHGWGSSIKSYPKLIQQLVDKNFQVIFLEFPSHGFSDKLDKPYKVSDFNNLILNFISYLKLSYNISLDAVYAHSNGCRVLIDILPKLTSNLDVFIVAGAGIKYRKNLFQKIVSLLSRFKKVIRFMPFFKTIRGIILRLISAHDYLKIESDIALKETFINLINYDAENSLQNIYQHVHLIWGDKDTYTPLYMAEIMNQKIKNSKLTIIKDMTHGIHIKDPNFLATYINQHTS
ncbi:alpha/beta hydrolase [bacterium]|jgi:pimeloyl-ACP methyl ester carboxylesterase|nr:alpha/beta hydrolase [bacterium]MBT6294009.1 alpha/beta hydrolase [bacterium]